MQQPAAQVPTIQARPRAQAPQMGAPGRFQPIRASASAAPRVSTAPGQRFLPSGNPGGGAYMGAIPLSGGLGQQQPFLGAVQVGQQMRQEVPMQPPEPKERRGPSERALERRRAWGQLNKLEAEELANYLADISARMGELNIPAGIVKKYEEKLRGFAQTAAPQAELQLSEAEIAELDQAILSYEEVESRETVKLYAVGAAAVAAVGIGLAILL